MSKETTDEAKASAISYLRSWGESPIPPTVTATLIFAQHARPFQVLPMLFPPVFLINSYMNINGNVKDSAGTNAAWSGLFLLLAQRRKYKFFDTWGTRGIVRGTTMGLCAVNLVGGGMAYALNSREDEDA